MHRRHLIAALVATSVVGSAMAQTYPNKVIRLQVPFAPGGTTDIIARVISEPLAKAIGQSVIVENKAGGGGGCGRERNGQSSARWLQLGRGHGLDHGGQPRH